MFLNSRFDGRGENYRLRTTRIAPPYLNIGPAHVQIARPQPNWTSKELSANQQGISTCFRCGRLMACCETAAGESTLPSMAIFFPWTAGRITAATPTFSRARFR